MNLKYYSDYAFRPRSPFISAEGKSGLNSEVHCVLFQVATLVESLNWEPLQVETSVKSELRSQIGPRSTRRIINMTIVGNLTQLLRVIFMEDHITL